MDNRDHDPLNDWADAELAELTRGRANDAFIARVRTEHARRKRPVIAIIGVAAALVACALLAFVLFPTAPAVTAPPQSPLVVDAEPPRPAQEDWIEPSAATLATLTRLNSGGDLDSLVLSRADCVAWTRTVNPLGR